MVFVFCDSCLEETNKRLVKENKALQQEITMLKSQLDSRSTTSSIDQNLRKKFDINENFAYYQIPKLISEDEDQVRLTQICMAVADVGDSSPARITIIK